MNTFGRKNNEEKLRRLAEGRLSHAYVITGQGRAEFAHRLAGALICEGETKPCGKCAHCKKAAMKIHPDVTTVSIPEDKREIVVEQIRDLRSDAYVRPNEARKKVYIIDPASAMNDSAQNALLKVLEEGPAYAAFLLVADQPGMLLQTVRSRCEEIVLLDDGNAGEERDERAERLADLLIQGEELPVQAFCVGLEKLSREEMGRLLEDTVSALEEKIKGDIYSAGKIVSIIDKLKPLRSAAQFHIGVGHLAGWLCAAVFE